MRARETPSRLSSAGVWLTEPWPKRMRVGYDQTESGASEDMASKLADVAEPRLGLGAAGRESARRPAAWAR